MSVDFLGARGRVAYFLDDAVTSLAADQVGPGVTVFDKFVAYRSGDDIRFYDRVCDHNGGNLISLPDGNGLLRCPLHDWTFDPARGHYTNINRAKDPLPFDRKDGQFLVRTTQRRMDWPLSPAEGEGEGEGEVELTFLNHACFVVDLGGKLRFATDPWVLGSAFCDGWWLSQPSPIDAIDRLAACDFIYISHNHPDHLHEETLRALHPDTRFVVPNFKSKSVESYLRHLGFDQVYSCDFGQVFDFGLPGFRFTILKSGDFRDDSGIVFSFGDFLAVLSVDCNALNTLALPRGAALLATSFAGGASGFPLCFDNYDETEKARITARNRSAAAHSVDKYIAATTPAYYVPYAGYFKEDPDRDGYVASRNRKNSVPDIARHVAARGIEVLDPTASRVFRFRGKTLAQTGQVTLADTTIDPVDWYTRSAARFGDVSDDEINVYFRGAKFTEALVLYLNLCDDAFNGLGRTYAIDFRGAAVQVSRIKARPSLEDIRSEDGTNRVILDVRAPAFGRIVRDFLPWEDFMIGFQARLERWPNVYNARMWYYFTNEYIADYARKASFDCGQSCERLGQEVF